MAVLPEGERGAIYTQFSRDDALLFVSEERNMSLAVIDAAAARKGSGRGSGSGSLTVIGRIPVGQAPVGLALSPDGTRLFSTSEIAGSSGECKAEQGGGRPHAPGGLFAIDVAKAATDPRHAVLGAVRAGCNPVRVVISADGRTLWVSQRGDGRVMALDPAALTLGATPAKSTSIAVGRSPVGLALRPDGAQLWIANSDRFGSGGAGLALIAPAGPAGARVVATMKMGGFPRDLRFLPDGRTLVVALYGEGAVLLHRTDDAPAGAATTP